MTTSRVMMALGDFRFSIDTAAYQTLTRQDGWRWAASDRLGKNPALQYVGPSATTIELDGVILPAYRGGIYQVQRMREMAAQGEPLLLVSGLGDVVGRFCITAIEETGTNFMAIGVARHVAFRLSLMAYGEDL